MDDYIIGVVAYMVIITIGIGCVAAVMAAVEWLLKRWK